MINRHFIHAEFLKNQAQQGTTLYKYVFALSILFLFVFSSHFCYAKTMVMKEDPAVVIVAFGTTTKASAAYDFFNAQLKEAMPQDYRSLKVEWAFSSEIVRQKANKQFKEAGIDKRYLSLPQVLSNLQDEGYRKIIIQPIVIFPGQEYDEILSIVSSFRQLGLTITCGEALLGTWENTFEVLNMLQKEFLSSSEGCNVIVSHGSPKTYASSNAVYLALDEFISRKYENAYLGSIEGIPSRELVLSAVKQCKLKKIRFIPFMYVAGDHVMNDIMGDDPKELSWASEMKEAGFTVDTVYTDFQGEKFYKGLGFYKEINRLLIEQLIKSLDKTIKPFSETSLE
ncbi:anaerobic cobalt chelatase [Candidatus Magnetoovum chiemensis]|nr:anaerobic cobalt chelatase [Candidatus Magnetoovum chiemensis]